MSNYIAMKKNMLDNLFFLTTKIILIRKMSTPFMQHVQIKNSAQHGFPSIEQHLKRNIRQPLFSTWKANRTKVLTFGLFKAERLVIDKQMGKSINQILIHCHKTRMLWDLMFSPKTSIVFFLCMIRNFVKSIILSLCSLLSKYFHCFLLELFWVRWRHLGRKKQNSIGRHHCRSPSSYPLSEKR